MMYLDSKAKGHMVHVHKVFVLIAFQATIYNAFITYVCKYNLSVSVGRNASQRLSRKLQNNNVAFYSNML